MNEHRAVVRRRPSVLQVVRQRDRDLLWKRHASPSPALARWDSERAGAPVDVVKRDGRNLASAQGELDEAHNDRVVAPPELSRAVERCEEGRKLGVTQDSWHVAQSPHGCAWNCRGNASRANSLQAQEPDQSPHGIRDDVCRTWTQALGASCDEVTNVDGAQRVEIDSTVGESSDEQSANLTLIATTRRGREAASMREMPVEHSNDPVHPVHRGLGGWG